MLNSHSNACSPYPDTRHSPRHSTFILALGAHYISSHIPALRVYSIPLRGHPIPLRCHPIPACTPALCVHPIPSHIAPRSCVFTLPSCISCAASVLSSYHHPSEAIFVRLKHPITYPVLSEPLASHYPSDTLCVGGIPSPVRRSLRRWYPITHPALSASVASHHSSDALCVGGIPLPIRRSLRRWHPITRSTLSASAVSHYPSGALCAGGLPLPIRRYLRR
jgi:hypothetical protein